MRPGHPFVWLTPSAHKRAFVLLTVFTLLVGASMQALGSPLKTEAARRGILSFEFAGDVSTAQRMVESWGPKGQVVAGLNLGLDYLFMVSYASAIGLGCVLIGRSLSGRAAWLGLLGVILAWGQWLAAALDGVENYALIRVLLGSAQSVWPALAWWCAAVKFLIVGLGLATIILGGLVAVLRARRGRTRAA